MNHAEPHNLEKCKDDCKLHWQNVKVSVEEVIKVELSFEEGELVYYFKKDGTEIPTIQGKK